MHTLTILRIFIALLVGLPCVFWALVCLVRYGGGAALTWFVTGVALAELIAPTPDALRSALDRFMPND